MAGDRSRRAGNRIQIDEESIRKCLSSECSSCRENCPSYLAFELDSYSSRGKNRALAAYLQGTLTIEDIRELVYACTNCGHCAEVCLTGGSFSNQVLELREQLGSLGKEAPGLREMVAYIRERSTPYGTKDTSWMEKRDKDKVLEKDKVKSLGKDKDKVLEKDKSKVLGKGKGEVLGEDENKIQEKDKDMVLGLVKEKIQEKDKDKVREKDKSKDSGGNPRKGRIGYFPGCTIQAEHPEFASKTISLLRKLGKDAVPISQPCCGFPVVNAGFMDEARTMAREFMEEVRRRGIRTIITSCAGCTAMLRLQLPHLIGVNIKVQHITEFLARNRKNVQAMFGTVGQGKDVLYHDPCDLARKLGIIEEPRIVIQALGFSVREFADNREGTACCGGGGGFAREYPDETVHVSRVRIREARDLGWNTVVTACLSCRRMLRSVPNDEVEVLDIIELFPENL